MSEELLRVYLGPKSESLINRANAVSPQLGQTLQDLSHKAMGNIANLAIRAYMTKVPIDTGEFRGAVPNSGFIRNRYSSMDCTIFIESGDHMGRDNKPIEAITLSRLLDSKNGGNRTKDSHIINLSGFSNYLGEPKDTPTAGWSKKAFGEFKSALPQYLSSVRLT